MGRQLSLPCAFLHLALQGRLDHVIDVSYLGGPRERERERERDRERERQVEGDKTNGQRAGAHNTEELRQGGIRLGPFIFSLWLSSALEIKQMNTQMLKHN